MLKPVRFFGAAVGLALVMSALTIGSAFAANNHGGTTATTATVVVSPDPAPANSYVQISGCGYSPGVWVEITVQEPVALGFTSALSDGTGCISHSWFVEDPYTYTITTYENATSKHPTLMARTTVLVQ